MQIAADYQTSMSLKGTYFSLENFLNISNACLCILLTRESHKRRHCVRQKFNFEVGVGTRILKNAVTLWKIFNFRRNKKVEQGLAGYIKGENGKTTGGCSKTNTNET